MLYFSADVPAEPASLVTTLASHGVLGIVTALALWFAYAKDRQLQDERLARITDAKSYNELALKLQAQVLDAVNKLADILEEMKKFMAPPQGPAPRRGSFGGPG